MIGAANAMRWVGGVGIVTIAAMRCAIVFASQVEFETDPATDLVSLAGLAMGGSLWLDVLLMLSCGVALAGEWLAKRSIEGFMMLLALGPFVVIASLRQTDLGDVWRGSTWAAAMVAAVAIAHLARDRQFGIVLASVLVGVVAYISVRGVAQVTFEHADTVREFERSKDQFLSDRGWSTDSAAARIFERRLRQPQPTGWFPTTNIFGSLMAFGFVAWAGWMACAVRARLQSGWPAAMGLLAAASAAMLWFTGSKGAILAAVMGLALAIAPLVFVGIRRVFERRGGAVCVGLIAMALIAIIVRGTVLPESFAGDRSLLFRWHYLVASARTFSANALTGVGPDGFQDAYTLFRVPRNPEEVQSAHSMFADWLSTLGIAGGAWVALTLLLAWRAGSSLAAPSNENAVSDSKAAMKRTIIVTLAVVGLGLVSAMAVEWEVMDESSLRVRCIGALAFVVVAVITSGTIALNGERFVNWVLAAAAMTVLIHGQVEMTFHYGGSVAWAMCVLGVAAARTGASARIGRAVGAFMVVAVVGCALWIAMAAIATGNNDRRMALAADALRATHDADGLCEARRRVAGALGRSMFGSFDHRMQLASIQQFVLASEECPSEMQVELLQEAVKVAEYAMTRFDRQAVIVAAIGAHARLAAVTSNPAQWNRAAELATEITRCDPHGISSWRNLGDVLWAAGQFDQAADAYGRTLQYNANFELDELKQLSDRDRGVIESRIAQARQPQRGSTSP